jgi:transposase
MSQNFLPVDREQLYLMPPSVSDWLPEDHFAWFILDVVAELDLSSFVEVYRDDGRGGAAYHPMVMVAVLLYAYCSGERSSRRIERRCREDVGYRVVAANHSPDHATIARFRQCHQEALGGLFAQVLRLCADAGLIRPEMVAIDGTRMGGVGSELANRTAEELAAEVLAEAEATDVAEDASHGAARGDELPPSWTGRGGRRARVREALRQLEEDHAKKSYEADLARRAHIEAETGKKLRGRQPTPGGRRRKQRKWANVTDPDSRLLKTASGFVQGYNAQAAVTADQVVVAAEVTNQSHDQDQFEPMITAVQANLAAAAVNAPLASVIADAGYWSHRNASLDLGPTVLIATGKRHNLADLDPPTTPSGEDGVRTAVLERVCRGELTAAEAGMELGITSTWIWTLLKRHRAQQPSVLVAMQRKLATEEGRRLYARRAASVEPVFAQTKHDRGFRHFVRRGLVACDSEWKLIHTTHNLLKLWRQNTIPAPAP